jgi:hypothetical protein
VLGALTLVRAPRHWVSLITDPFFFGGGGGRGPVYFGFALYSNIGIQVVWDQLASPYSGQQGLSQGI